MILWPFVAAVATGARSRGAVRRRAGIPVAAAGAVPGGGRPSPGPGSGVRPVVSRRGCGESDVLRGSTYRLTRAAGRVSEGTLGKGAVVASMER